MSTTAGKCLKYPDAVFLNDVHFCECYFKAAVEHFEKTKHPLETRYGSWEQCYCYFRGLKNKNGTLTNKEVDEGALRLAFYMASWGMYRGSSFLLQNDATIYRGLVGILFQSKYDDLWNLDAKIIALPNNLDPQNLDALFLSPISKCFVDLCNEINTHFMPYKRYQVQKSYFTKNRTPKYISQTLITKLILGTIGCYPALDRYFCEAVGPCGKLLWDDGKNSYREDCIKAIFRLAYYVKKNCLQGFSVSALSSYPVMKLIDMYYFGKGLEAPFLQLLFALKRGNKTVHNLAAADQKLLRDFVLADDPTRACGKRVVLSSTDACILDIAFPCIPSHCDTCKRQTGQSVGNGCPLFYKKNQTEYFSCSDEEFKEFIEKLIKETKTVISKLSDVGKDEGEIE